MKKTLIITLMLLLLVGSCSAIVTEACTGVTNRHVDFHASGSLGGTGWFEWGGVSGSSYIWRTPNQSTTGVFTDYWDGLPMLTSKTYYVRACDRTGCGGQVAWTVPAADAIQQTWFGVDVLSIQRSGFNLTKTVPIILSPYTGVFSPWGTSAGMMSALVWAILFIFIFAGYTLRQKNTTIMAFLAMGLGSALITGGSAFFGLPPEFIGIGYGLLVASVAGMFMSWVSK